MEEVKHSLNPDQRAAQKRRQQFLASQGVDAKNQHVAVHTLQLVQDAALKKTEEACIYYLRRWEKELSTVEPENFTDWMTQKDAIFAATLKTQDKLTGNHSLIYCYYRKDPETKRAFEINFKVLPQLDGKGIFRLDVDHVEVPFPANVKVEG